MSGARVLLWPLLMGMSVMAGLVLAFLGSGVWDALGWLMAGSPLLPVARRLFASK